MALLGQLTNLLGRVNSAIAAYRGLDEILSGENEEETAAQWWNAL